MSSLAERATAAHAILTTIHGLLFSDEEVPTPRKRSAGRSDSGRVATRIRKGVGDAALCTAVAPGIIPRRYASVPECVNLQICVR